MSEWKQHAIGFKIEMDGPRGKAAKLIYLMSRRIERQKRAMLRTMDIGIYSSEPPND